VTERTIRKFDSLCGLWLGSRDRPLWLLFVCLSAARLVRSGDEILFLRCEIRCRNCGTMAGPAGMCDVGRVSVVARRARATNVSSPLRPTIAAHATLSRFICCSRLLRSEQGSETQVGSRQQSSKNPIPHTHIGHRPTNSSYNRRPEDSTSATQVPSRDSPGTAIIQPRSASVLGHGVPRSSEFHSRHTGTFTDTNSFEGSYV